MADQPLVGIIMGSKSDLGVMEGCTAELEALGVPYELVIASAHRTPAKVHEWASTAADRGIKVIIAAAGKAAQSEADAKVAAVIAAGKATQAAADKREAAYADAVKAFQAQVAAREAAYVKAVLGK